MRHAATALAILSAASVAACGEPVDETAANAPPAAAPVAEAPPVTAPPAPAPQQPVVTTPSLAPPPPAAVTAGNFNLTGTEPFWGMKIRADTLTFSRMDHPEVSVPAPRPQSAGAAMVWKTERLTVTLKPANCSDGMSDRQYPYDAEVRLAAEVLKGCAWKL